jgi:ferrous iron transport protein A
MALPTEALAPALPIDVDVPLAKSAGVPLSSLAPGDRATIHAVDSSTPEGHRLLELGFLPDTQIRVVRRAPLGDPIAFYLRGGQICLRRSEAARIRVFAADAESET